MLALGILGLYLGRIFEEIKQRPLYIIEKISDEIAFHEQKTRKNRTTKGILPIL